MTALSTFLDLNPRCRVLLVLWVIEIEDRDAEAHQAHGAHQRAHQMIDAHGGLVLFVLPCP